MEDVSLTFDPSMAINAIQQLTSSLDNFNSKFNGVARSTDTAVNEPVKNLATTITQKGIPAIMGFSGITSKVFGFMMNNVGKLMGGFMMLRGVMKFIPEIGRTFQIAGSIIMRNLLAPLRRELIPILQKVLNWVRDNRSLFVRIGGSIANFFRVVVSIVKGIYHLIKTLFSSFMGEQRRLFGNTIKTMQEAVNIFLFKLAVVVEFLKLLLTPVVAFIGRQIARLRYFFSQMVEGLSEGFGDLGEVIDDFLEIFGTIGDLMDTTDVSVRQVGAGFRILGNILGLVLRPIIALIASIIDGLVIGIQNLVQGIMAARAYIRGDQAEYRRLRDAIENRNREASNRQNRRWRNVANAMGNSIDSIQNNYEVMTTPDNPEGGNNNTTNVGTVNVQVEGGNNATQTGAQVANGISATLQNSRRGAGN